MKVTNLPSTLTSTFRNITLLTHLLRQRFLSCYKHEEDFLDHFVTGMSRGCITIFLSKNDIRWCEKNKQPAPKKFKIEHSASAGKVLLKLFWIAKGVLLQGYTPPGMTIKVHHHCVVMGKNRLFHLIDHSIQSKFKFNWPIFFFKIIDFYRDKMKEFHNYPPK